MVLDRKKIVGTLATLSLVLLFLNDHTVYSVFFHDVSSMFTVLAVLFMSLAFFFTGRFGIKSKAVITLIFWSLVILISCVSYGLTRMVYVRFAYWILTLLYVILMGIIGIDFKRIFFNVSKIFLLWALINYFLNLTSLELLPITSTSSSLLYNWYRVDLYGFLFSKSFSHLSVLGLSILRLDRPFGEPGIAQMYFNFGFLFACFFEKKGTKRTIWMILFTLGSLLSCSTTGYLIYFSVLLVYFIYKKRNVLAIIMGFVTIAIFGIILTAKTETFSFEDRSGDLVFMISTTLNNLPFGIGLGNTSTLQHNIIASTGQESVGFYCGLLYPVAQFGIFGIVYYYFLIQSIKAFNANKMIRIAFGLYIVLTLFTEPQADEPFIMAFIFSGLLYWSNKPVNDKEIVNYEKVTLIHD